MLTYSTQVCFCKIQWQTMSKYANAYANADITISISI